MNNQQIVRWKAGSICVDNHCWALNPTHAYDNKEVTTHATVQVEIDYYLRNFTYFMAPWGVVDPRFPLLAFSYGEGQEVNALIAQEIIDIMLTHVAITALVQWEITQLIISQQPQLSTRIQSIELEPGQSYMTTRQVASKALSLTSQRKINVISQLWHASRCIRQAEEQGWHCASLRGVDAFAHDDPQPWVQHPLNWIIKESRFRYFENQENNEAI
ncbi:hypothetical protein ACE1OE_03795 [Vibrio sp. E150_011]